VRLVLETFSNIEALPDIRAGFTARLVTDYRVATMTVFEMILAAGHDPQLSPVTRLLNERLAKLLKPYLGSDAAAHTVSAAMQGLVLTALAVDRPNSGKWFRSSVSDLIRRYRIVPSQKVANNSIPSKATQEKNVTVPHIAKRARLRWTRLQRALQRQGCPTAFIVRRPISIGDWKASRIAIRPRRWRK
jgi:hypothetical protein